MPLPLPTPHSEPPLPLGDGALTASNRKKRHGEQKEASTRYSQDRHTAVAHRRKEERVYNVGWQRIKCKFGVSDTLDMTSVYLELAVV